MEAKQLVEITVNGRRVVPVERAAVEVDRSVSTLRRWQRSGLLNPVRVGRYTYFDLDEVRRLAREGVA